MGVTRETIEHVAALARLDITDAEAEKFTLEMEKIIAWVDQLNELDTAGVKPMEHVIPLVNVLREDRVEGSYDRGIMLANAPSAEDGCFKVPKVVE